MLYLKESVDVVIRLNFLEWTALVLAVEGIRYLAAGMSNRSSTTLYRRLSCIFAPLVSKVSHFRWSSREVTLLVFPYLFVAKRAARRWTISTFLIWSVLWGLHTPQQYSKLERTMQK